ncbi:hypothetical protein [Litorilituus sediminis]|uniref:Uncharacterized protein n=1 Tax=Litorilituus sediminis TaxID=718192 RepID=A0A4P6P4W0_9GAMM|nr:hypothetical protein [Litorilituus sediminis]QBG34447.1 hypothetical protein EMK97_01190 [Litorilituus sediminis]
MKVSILLVFLISAYCSAASTKELTAITNIPSKVFAIGNIYDLNKTVVTTFDKQHWIKYIEVPDYTATCVSETDIICNYNYYFSISELDNSADYKVYKVSSLGEIVKVEWVSENILSSKLLLTIKSYKKSKAITLVKELSIKPSGAYLANKQINQDK